ncbi:unnamed protein product [Pleuronectes platessa]|uniref:Uncharacterized protein n=1 Tax=Pleuronectes platessa TaxID=8262 RepID=A0A9N7YJJ3_PLEPL|nr:unnamed protein product [Pleuronectes platessa]
MRHGPFQSETISMHGLASGTTGSDQATADVMSALFPRSSIRNAHLARKRGRLQEEQPPNHLTPGHAAEKSGNRTRIAKAQQSLPWKNRDEGILQLSFRRCALRLQHSENVDRCRCARTNNTRCTTLTHGHKQMTHLSCVSLQPHPQTHSREPAWPLVDPAVCRGCLLWVADAAAEGPHLYDLLRGASLQPHLVTGTWGAVGGPRSLQKGSGMGGGRWRGGIHNGSLALQQRARRHQPPPAPTGSHPVPVPRRRAPADATLVAALEVIAAPAPVLVPRRRVPADATLVPASAVLAVPAPVPVPRRRVPADATLVPASAVLAVPAPVPVPRRRVPADATLVPASAVLAVPAPVPVPRRRVPADATLVPASEVLAVPAPVPVPRRRVPADASLVLASEVLAVPAPEPSQRLRRWPSANRVCVLWLRASLEGAPLIPPTPQDRSAFIRVTDGVITLLEPDALTNLHAIVTTSPSTDY